MNTFAIRRAHRIDDRQIDELSDLLIDCVEGGASVSFLHPLSHDKASAFWVSVSNELAQGSRALIIAEDEVGVCGTVQLILNMPENQPHRADLAKMLVHRRARRMGLGQSLLRSAETTGLECGKTLLMLDAVTGGDAARLYERGGWSRVGDVPLFALMPDGRPCSTTYYYKELRQ